MYGGDKAMNDNVSEAVKRFYQGRSETNWIKRYQSPYLLRRYFSRVMWEVTAAPVKEYPLVLDAGCGDGVLSVMMALWHPQQKIIAMDISEEGVRRAREAAIAHGVAERMTFIVGDVENLPFKSNSLPAVVSCQVIEHLPDFDRGVQEIARVLCPDGIAVISIPACLNLSAMVLLGGDNYWRISKRTPFAFWKGLGRVVWAWLKREEGVNEGYAGHKELPHLRRFPWRAVQRIERNGLQVITWSADSLLIPYLSYLFPYLIHVQWWIDKKLRAKPFWRNFGVGIVMTVRRKQ
jgi:SAM-dependent methyltransferase